MVKLFLITPAENKKDKVDKKQKHKKKKPLKKVSLANKIKKKYDVSTQQINKKHY